MPLTDLGPPELALHDQNLEHEMLACMIHSERACREVLGIVREEDLTQQRARDLFGVIRRAFDEGEVTDALGARARLRTEGRLEDLSGYLVDVIASDIVPTYGAAFGHVRAGEIRRLARLRRLQHAGIDISEAAPGPGSIDKKIAQAEQLLGQVAGDERSTVTDATHAADAVLEDLELRAQGTLPGVVPTGLHDLDRLLNGGLHPGHLIVVGARPSVGKSALACNVALRAMADALGVLFCSLEMSAREVALRWAVDGVGRAQWLLDPGSVAEFTNRLATYPVEIMGSPTTTVAIRSQAKAMQRKKLALIVVDYVQLLTGSAKENRALEVGEYARSLKVLAGEMDVPILALAQLNREIEHRPDGMPRLADLRDSGELEQHADEVILLHRKRQATEAEAIVAKHRNGPTATILLTYRPETMRFVSRAVA